MWIFQTILVIFFLFAIAKVWGRYQTKDLSWRGAGLWSVFWVLAGVVVLWPNSTAFFAKRLGLGRGVDLVIYLALAGLFFVVFRLMVKIERLNREITLLTRRVALDDSEESKQTVVNRQQ